MAFKAKQTAIGTAALRAIEHHTSPEQRLCSDPLARPLCGRWLGPLLSPFASRHVLQPMLRLRERQLPGVVGVLLCRFAYLDDVFRDALSNGVRSVVILGAGFDSRAYRLPGADAVIVFEVDHPSVQDLKRSRLRRHLGTLPSHVRFVPIDFDTQDLAVALAAAGYEPVTRTLFMWEGVSQYVSRAALEGTLDYVGGTAPGNQLVFSYVLQRFIDDRSAYPELSPLWDTMRTGDEPFWKSGLDPEHLADTLSRFSLRLSEDIGAPEHRTRYLIPKGRSLNVCDIERIAVAEVKGFSTIHDRGPRGPSGGSTMSVQDSDMERLGS